MIRLENLTRQFPDRVLFRDVNLTIPARMRAGLTGDNGSGKTTLLRLILGLELPDTGTILKAPGLTLGYLPQDIIPGSRKSILEEVMLAFPEIARLEEELYLVAQRLAGRPQDETLLNRLSRLQLEYERLEGWSLEDRAAKLLSGLGFREEQLHEPLQVFSGGWRMRVALAGILLQEPDFLLLDEPSNHLDLEALVWLESFLAGWPGGMLVISHDRVFLDRIVNNIIEIDRPEIRLYPGNYSRYLEQKQLRRKQQQAAYDNQQRQLAATERFIERFRYKNTKARQVQSRVRMLDKLERVEAPGDPRRRRRVIIPQPNRAPLRVVECRHVVKRYGANTVYSGLDLAVERGQKIGLVGKNGAGKSTLLKLLAGVEAVTAGSVETGPGVVRGYFAQHQREVLDPGLSVFETLQNLVPDWTISQTRGYLGGFLFSGAAVDKPVRVLSGGEQSRLALACLLVKQCHLLLMDEPTNHLDIPSRDVVEQALRDYTGTLVCISHDRHFLNAVTNTTLEIEQGAVRVFPGNYDYYQWKRGRETAAAQPPVTGTRAAGKPVRAAERKQRQRRENELKKMERRAAELEQLLEANAAIYKDPAQASAYQVIQEALEHEQELETEYLAVLERSEQLRRELDRDVPPGPGPD